MAMNMTALVQVLLVFLGLIAEKGIGAPNPMTDGPIQLAGDTEGIVKRGPSCAVGQYDETLSSGVESLSYKQMYDLIKYNSTDYVLVDVRTPSEYADGHIPTAFLVTITNGKFEDHIDFRQIMCGRKFIVVYCRSGSRAQTAVRLLKSSIPVKGYYGSWLEWSRRNPRNIIV